MVRSSGLANFEWFDVQRPRTHVEQLLHRRLDRPSSLAWLHVGRQELAILTVERGESRGITIGNSVVKRLRNGVDFGNGNGLLPQGCAQ
jgi:hypothetical protein